MVTMPIKSDFEPMPQELLEMSDVEVNKKFFILFHHSFQASDDVIR